MYGVTDSASRGATVATIGPSPSPAPSAGLDDPGSPDRTDPLTTLRSRVGLLSTIREAANLPRYRGYRSVLMIAKVRGFRQINDWLGTTVGDELLTILARRLEERVGFGVTLARTAGTEFAVHAFCRDTRPSRTTDHIGRLADDLLKALEDPLSLGGRTVQVSAHLGVATADAGTVEPEELLRRASVASARHLHRCGVGFQTYDPGMDVASRREVEADSELLEALEQRALAIHLQPRLDVATGALRGAEALLRWKDPDPNKALPARLVEAAERNGTIVTLGRWVLAETIDHAVALVRAGVLRDDMSLSVNVSSQQVQDPRFVSDLVALLERAGLSPRALTVELTETGLMTDLGRARQRLKALSSIGVALSIDDFGTGYSSLAYLRELPVQELKLDRRFVADLDRHPEAEVIARAVIDIARGTGLTTVAEGVERPSQLSVLRGLGCDQYQGYLTSTAIPLTEFMSRYGR